MWKKKKVWSLAEVAEQLVMRGLWTDHRTDLIYWRRDVLIWHYSCLCFLNDSRQMKSVMQRSGSSIMLKFTGKIDNKKHVVWDTVSWGCRTSRGVLVFLEHTLSAGKEAVITQPLETLFNEAVHEFNEKDDLCSTSARPSLPLLLPLSLGSL